MAEKKSNSRALKAVNETKKKTGNPTTSVKKPEPSEPKKKGAVQETQEPAIPVRALLAVLTLGLFIFFLFMGIKPEGAL